MTIHMISKITNTTTIINDAVAGWLCRGPMNNDKDCRVGLLNKMMHKHSHDHQDHQEAPVDGADFTVSLRSQRTVTAEAVRLYQYIIIYYIIIVFKVRNSNTRGKDKVIIIILLTMATCSILLSEHWHELVPKGTSRGSRSFPSSWAFLFENCWFGGMCKRPKILNFMKCLKLGTKT